VTGHCDMRFLTLLTPGPSPPKKVSNNYEGASNPARPWAATKWSEVASDE